MKQFRIQLKGTLTTTVVGEKDSTVHNLDTTVTIDDTTVPNLLNAGQKLVRQATAQIAKALRDVAERLDEKK